MSDLWFYTQIGLDHVLDLNAYDHILFLIALTLPFSFKSWRKVLILATVFTISHCTSLALSSYELMEIEVVWIEFLIPITIVMTAVFNLLYVQTNAENDTIGLHILATTFFGLIHGFGFSNYFKMLVADQDSKLPPLIGFAVGIEISQVIIVLGVLFITYAVTSYSSFKQSVYIKIASLLIILATIPMLIETFPL